MKLQKDLIPRGTSYYYGNTHLKSRLVSKPFKLFRMYDCTSSALVTQHSVFLLF